MENIETFGKYIKELRKKAGLSQRDLAEKANIDFTYLSKIENGKMAPPSEDTIKKIAEALNEDPDKLIIMADKIPSDYKPLLQSSPEVPMLLRTIGKGNFSSDKLKKLVEEAKKLGDDC
jgi:HTH-type transcriptional regulator, competence development regulator